MTTRHFCTLFDSFYLIKGVAMLRSLARHCPQAHVHVLCMDARAQQILAALALPNLSIMTLAEIEDEALLAAKRDRSIAEYCWTLTPCLPWRILQDNPDIDAITYIDADLLFYSGLEPLFEEIGDNSIAIIEHRYTPALKAGLEINGRFCVEWVSFRRDAEGLACLERWRDQCIEWCYAEPDDGRMGDQKYLDEWPERYAACHILQHLGAGVAPWNYAQYVIAGDDDGGFTIDGAPLIFYHFHQFRMFEGGGFDPLPALYSRFSPAPAAIYKSYEAAIGRALAEIRAVDPGFSAGFTPTPRQNGLAAALPAPLQHIWKRIAGHD